MALSVLLVFASSVSIISNEDMIVLLVLLLSYVASRGCIACIVTIVSDVTSEAGAVVTLVW